MVTLRGGVTKASPDTLCALSADSKLHETLQIILCQKKTKKPMSGIIAIHGLYSQF